MTSASHDLQRSVFIALTSSAPLTALLGGPHVYDDVPRHAAFPYVTIGQSTVRDWSTGGELGHEHILTLHVWSRAAGRKETYEIISALEATLHDASLALSQHRLVNLRHEVSDARRDPDGETYHGVVRYRAVTEPI